MRSPSQPLLKLPMVNSHSHETKQKWIEVRSWYEKNPIINMSNDDQHYTYVTDAHGYDPEGVEPIDQSTLGEIVFCSRADMLLLLFNFNFIQSNFNTHEINFTPQMDQILLPSLS